MSTQYRLRKVSGAQLSPYTCFFFVKPCCSEGRRHLHQRNITSAVWKKHKQHTLVYFVWKNACSPTYVVWMVGRRIELCSQFPSIHTVVWGEKNRGKKESNCRLLSTIMCSKARRLHTNIFTTLSDWIIKLWSWSSSKNLLVTWSAFVSYDGDGEIQFMFSKKQAIERWKDWRPERWISFEHSVPTEDEVKIIGEQLSQNLSWIDETGITTWKMFSHSRCLKVKPERSYKY